MRFGIDQARRAWLTVDDVLNTRRSTLFRPSILGDRYASLQRHLTRGAASPRLCGDLAKAQQREAQEQPADQGDREELRPDHVEAGAAIEDRLRKRHEMRRGRCLHDGAQERRHALERRIAAGEHVHRKRDQHVQQAELRHRARDGAEKDADRGREEQIDRDAGQEERDRAGDRNAEEAADDESQATGRPRP